MHILEAAFLITDADAPVIENGAVAVEHGRVVETGSVDHLRRLYPDSTRTLLGDALILPGFVNAHQHGRGLSQIQLGYPDDALEPWIARRRGRGSPDSYALTRLAALEMLANGVTATLHANYSYATGDYEAELRGSIRAYEETGLRATICVGYADRGGLVYPPADEAAFAAGLSHDARSLLQAAPPAYLPLPETLDLMARLRAEYRGHPTLRFAYGPAGPQWVSDEAWRALARDAAEIGVGLHFHLLESPVQSACAGRLYPGGSLAHLKTLGVFTAPASAAHFVHAGPRDIADAARLGLVVVTNPGSNMRLFNGGPPLGAMLDAGVELALGTDNCALDDNEDYLSELRLGGLLMRRPGADAKHAARRLLRTGTEAGAAAAFLKEEIGALRPGMKADLIALDLANVRGAYLEAEADVLDAVLARGCGRDIALTMVEGQVCYRRGASSEQLDAARTDAAVTAMRARSRHPTASSAAETIVDAVRKHYAAET
ncbi:amidohydrolase family protein [Terrihabitans rhizophilus]|uniref:Amidohydrolase family protein n=1 Tax=Terrihabitans rhizophilus TaxID=3092662 RepID=A0ABU4RQP2_9HYPH|nr:amidohydrolase family protein [Terrihabitans sp. PJ23]MDX6805950.1 amidohydrolase family protein [Terrihabitans sp. PJ23]